MVRHRSGTEGEGDEFKFSRVGEGEGCMQRPGPSQDYPLAWPFLKARQAHKVKLTADTG
jgi:hypothetical protein